MGLQVRYRSNGQYVKTWYGQAVVNGKTESWTLKTPFKGKPPLTPDGRITLRGEGNRLFEASRENAISELRGLEEEAKQKGRAENLVERLIEKKTGRQVEYVKVADLAARWRDLPREASPCAEKQSWADNMLNRFARAVDAKFLYEVTPREASLYMAEIRGQYAASTADGIISLLRSAFDRLLPVGMVNPFKARITRRGKSGCGAATIHKRPLTANELTQLFETARPDPFLYRLTVAAACTGMRIGDVCRLSWRSVDFRSDVLSVRTSKTGKPIVIPIFKPLRDVLDAALAERTGENEYVFPEAAHMYQTNRSGVVYRGKALFARTFFYPNLERSDVDENGETVQGRVKLKGVLSKVAAAVSGSGFAETKKERILDTLRRVAAGKSYRDIEEVTGRKRGQISEDLADAERVSGYLFRRGVSKWAGVRTMMDVTRQKREGTCVVRSASVLGWHSLRATFATLALSANVPLETVKLITGHSVVATLQKYYFNPTVEHLRAVLGDKLPDVLTGGGRRSKALECGSSNVGEMSVEELAKRVADRTATAEERKRLMELLGAPGRDWTAVTTSV
jgi:integrase